MFQNYSGHSSVLRHLCCFYRITINKCKVELLLMFSPEKNYGYQNAAEAFCLTKESSSVKVEACLSTPFQPRFIFLQQSKKKAAFKQEMELSVLKSCQARTHSCTFSSVSPALLNLKRCHSTDASFSKRT